MMKVSMWGGVAVAILILLGAAAYAAEKAPPDNTADADVSTPGSKSPKTLFEKREKLFEIAEKKRAAEEEKQRKQEKKAKIDKIQRKTGRTPTSWQVLNR